MKIILDVILVDGTNKKEFVDSFDKVSQVDWWNILEEIPNCISMHVEESFVEEFKKDKRIIRAEERLEAFPASLPAEIQITKTIISNSPSTGTNGSNYMPLQFYLDSDRIYPIPSGSKVGKNNTHDDISTISNATYKTRWAGKNVDIVSLEVGPISSSLANVHNSHPDFADLDNSGSSRVVPMNWLDLEDSSNNQISSNSCLSAHGMGVLSAAGGSICGFAKRSSLRAAYITSEDGVVECINAIISWHNNKPINPDTGIPNPTIMIGEYQYLQDRRYGVPIDYVSSIQDIYDDEILTYRPGESWGNDFTPFIEKNIIPFAVRNPTTLQYEWCVVLPNQFYFSSLKTALESAWNSGIVCINAAGNNGGVYRKFNDRFIVRLNIDATTPYTVYDISYGNPISTYNENGTYWYPFITYGPHGFTKSIDVAAGYNSEGMPVLDGYSNRGEGIDIIGLGANTWTSYPASTYADGNKWGMFSGTSCATPTVVGKAACLMERHYYYSGSWPTPDQVKSLLISSSREIVKGIQSTSWDNVPSPGTYRSNSTEGNLVRIYDGSGNGGYVFTELCGTPRFRSHFDPILETLDRTNIYKKRPTTGIMYPRTRIRNSIGFSVPDLPSGT